MLEPIVAFCLWLGAILFPGYSLTVWFERGETFTERITYSLGLGSAVLVAVFSLRSILPFDILFAGFAMQLVGFAALYASIIGRKPLGIPRPRRMDFVILLFVLAQSVIVWFYLAKYPLFSPFTQSGDYLFFYFDLSGYVAGHVPPFLTQLLYYGAYYHIALLSSLAFSDNLLLTERVGMYALSILSSFYLYLAVKKLASERAAVVTTMIYSFSAFLWFGMVENSGLYPNFYGLMASLFTIVVVKDIWTVRGTVSRAFFLLLSLWALAFSHYSAIFILPILALAVISSKDIDRKKRLILAAILILPIVGALPFVFPIAAQFVGSGAQGPALSGDPLASVLAPVPALAYIFLFTTNDAGSLIMFCLFMFYTLSMVRKRNAWLGLPGLWFLLFMSVSPFNASAWRFTFAALLPFIVCVGLGFDWITGWFASRFSTTRSKIRKSFKPRVGPLTFSILFLILAPIFYGSWGAVAFNASAPDGGQNAQHDYALWQTLQWIKQNERSLSLLNDTGARRSYGTYFTANDLQLGSARYLIGVPVTVDTSLATAAQVALSWANQHSKLNETWKAELPCSLPPILMTKPSPVLGCYRTGILTYPVYFVVTNANPPFSCLQYDIRLTPLNGTSGLAIKMRAEVFSIAQNGTESLLRQNVSANLEANGTVIQKFTVVNGNSTGVVQFTKVGTYRLSFVAGTIPSNTLTLFMGQDRNPLNTPINPYECWPWYWGDRAPFNGIKIVYQNSDVKVYEMTST